MLVEPLLQRLVATSLEMRDIRFSLVASRTLLYFLLKRRASFADRGGSDCLLLFSLTETKGFCELPDSPSVENQILASERNSCSLCLNLASRGAFVSLSKNVRCTRIRVSSVYSRTAATSLNKRHSMSSKSCRQGHQGCEAQSRGGLAPHVANRGGTCETSQVHGMWKWQAVNAPDTAPKRQRP